MRGVGHLGPGKPLEEAINKTASLYGLEGEKAAGRLKSALPQRGFSRVEAVNFIGPQREILFDFSLDFFRALNAMKFR